VKAAGDAARTRPPPAAGRRSHAPFFCQQGANNKNNYSRPGGQNVGNFLTDRSSSRISNPPGGHCQITFG